LAVNSTDPDLTPSCRNKSIEATFPEVGQRKASDGAASLAAAVPDRQAMSRGRVDKRFNAKRRDVFVAISKGMVF
jgi:hypothetical protein